MGHNAMRRRMLLEMGRWAPLSGVVLGFVIGSWVFLSIPAPSTSESATSDSLRVLLMPWWLLGLLLMLLGDWMRQINMVSAPRTLHPWKGADAIDDLTIPLAPQMRVHAVLAATGDDLTIPLTTMQSRRRWRRRG